MRVIANTWNNFFNASTVVTDDLRFSRFKIDRASGFTRLQQSTIDIVQINQIIDAVFSARGLWATRIRQDSSHLGVREPSMAKHHSRVKLVSMHFTRCGDQHIAHHA